MARTNIKRQRDRVKEGEATPKELVRRRKTRQQNRNLFIGLGALALVIVALFATALIQEFVVKPNSPVAVVEGSEIKTDVYQRRVLFQWDNLQRQLTQWMQLNIQYDSDPEDDAGPFDQQISQLRSQIENPELMGAEVLDRMIEEELIRQRAAEDGLQVSATEIDEEIERQFGFVRNPTPTPIVTPAIITSTQIITNSVGVTSTEVIESTATPRPTVALMTESEYQQNYSDTLGNLKDTLGFREADFRTLIESSLLENKLRERIGEGVSTTEEQVKARHILFKPDAEAEDQDAALIGAESRAQEAHERLVAGDDFAELALELSEDASNAEDGGDLGWFGRGRMQPEFEAVAFSQPVGQLSEPFTTTFGYHIVLVDEYDDSRDVEESTLNQRQSQAFDDWLQERLQTAAIERSWSAEKVPATPRPATPVAR